MSQFLIHVRFLNDLRIANPTVRCQMIRNMTSDQMSAIVKVVFHVTNGLIPTLLQDRDYFAQYRLVLRRLSSPRVPFASKRQTLLQYRNTTLLPRLLDTFYLVRTFRHLARSHEK